MIYAAPLIMQALGALMCAARRDLFLPSLGGAAVTLATYSALCLVLAALIPGVFNLDWKTERFLNRFVWGIPVEELLYAWTSGFVATCFYPSVMRLRFVPRVTTPLNLRPT